MTTGKQIWKWIVDLKNAYLVLFTLITVAIGWGEKGVNYLAEITAEKVMINQQVVAYKFYSLQRRQDSIRVEIAMDYATKKVAKLDSIAFMLDSVYRRLEFIDRRIGQIQKKMDNDTLLSDQQKELIELRRLWAERNATESAKIQIKKAMEEFFEKADKEMDQIKKGDRTP